MLEKLKKTACSNFYSEIGLEKIKVWFLIHKMEALHIKQKILYIFLFIFFFKALPVFALDKKSKKEKQVVYKLNIDYKTVHFTGKAKQAMAINNSIPAPALYFREGDTAVIHVTNQMNVESSIHWHGILLPNFQDGVPYLTTPPILSGQSLTYKFPLKQSGTYWYHSHTGLQEQRGLYGGIVIEPKQKRYQYDHNLVLVLSDWTDENPNEVMRNLKRGSEWYSIKKHSAQSLIEVIENKALPAQLAMWKNRMRGMDISDVYYPAFLINGQKEQNYYHFKPRDKIRLRIINASASTYFWLTFGGKKPLLISSDGLDVHPVSTQKILHAIGETYDFLITVPKGKSIQIRAMAQDGSGLALAHIGKGDILKAPLVPKPDLFQQMRGMADMHHGGGRNPTPSMKNSVVSHSHQPASHSHSKAGMENKNSHQPSASHSHSKAGMENKNSHQPSASPSQGKAGMENKNSHQPSASPSQGKAGMENKNSHQPSASPSQGKAGMENKNSHQPSASHSHSKEEGSFSYQDLKSLEAQRPQSFVREITFNLTGNMRRYVWSMNNKVLSESDAIQIKKGERLRITLNNTTMMHHPMHLHGHFFRVLTKQGKYSPLKHTVDIPPMETLVIEFDPDEKGDWFFHCHVLYHMMGGMTRVFRNGNLRDSRLKAYPAETILNKDNKWFWWGETSLMSHLVDLEWTFSNTRNQILKEVKLSWLDHKYQWNQNFELSLSYERFISDFFRLYAELEIENAEEDFSDVDFKMGFRYLLPYFIALDMSLDHKARWEVELEYELLFSPRLELMADWSLKADLGLFTQTTEWEQEWSAGFEYALYQYFSFIGNYSSRFGWGAGLNIKY